MLSLRGGESEKGAPTADAPSPPPMARPRLRRWMRQRMPVVVLAVVAAVVAVAVQRNILPFYSADADEPVYRFQAQMLLDGKLNLPMSQAHFFNPWLGGHSSGNGRMVMAFTWGWPAVLAASQWLFHTMLVTLAAAAALAAVACYLFAREVFDDQRRALLSAALFSLSPFLLLQSGTYLNYVFAVAVELFAGWMFLRGRRTGSRRWLASAGLLFSLVIVIRPYDALLAVLPFVALAMVASWRRWREMARIGLPAVAGAVPGVVLALALNVATTGRALLFPTPAQSGGGARFFWGNRDIVPGHHSSHFTFTFALGSTWRNLVGWATWPIGTYLALAVALFGAVMLYRHRRRESLGLLVAMLVVFPLGYVAWFAIALSEAGATNGIGPHYYLPMMAPLSMLTAYGLFELWRQRRALVGVVVVGAAVLTVVSVIPKLDEKHPLQDARRSYVRQVNDGLKQRGNRDALLVLEPWTWYPNVMGTQPNLANDPTLSGSVLYAVDHGSDEIDLLRRYPHRAAYRIVRRYEPGADLTKPSLVVKPLAVFARPTVEFRTTIHNINGNPIVTAYVGQGTNGKRRSVVLDRHSTRGRSYDVVWRVAPDGTVAVASNGKPAEARGRLASSGLVTIGAVFANRHQRGDPGRIERRYEYRRRGGSVQVLTADQEWVRFGSPIDAWLQVDLASQLDVTISG